MLGLEGQPGCVTEEDMSLLPTHRDPGTGGQLLLLSLTSRRLSPALLSQMLEPSSAAPEIKGSGQNCYVPHTCSPFDCTLLYQHCLPDLKLVKEERLLLLVPCITSCCFQG